MNFTDSVQVILRARTNALRHVPGASLRSVGPLWCWHYEQPVCWESEAFLALDLDPGHVVDAIRGYGPGAHLIAAYTSQPNQDEETYRRLGYKTVTQEPDELVMTKALSHQMPVDQPTHVVEQVVNQADLDLMTGDSAMEPLAPWVGDDPNVRGYVVRVDGKVVSKGIMYLDERGAVYLGGLFTHPAYRRQGTASSMMDRMHRDAVAIGCTDAVLVAMPMGVSLYQTCGYAAVGYVRKFVPLDWVSPWSTPG